MPPTTEMPSRRQLLALCAALAATTLTAAAAVAGLTRHPSAQVPVVPTVVQQQPAAPFNGEPQEPGG